MIGAYYRRNKEFNDVQNNPKMIMQEIEVGSTVDIKLTLITAIGNLPVPCLPVSPVEPICFDYLLSVI